MQQVNGLGVRKVVIPVAGLGTRSLPFTKVVPKELLPVIDTPSIHLIVEEALQAGIEEVIFVTGEGKGALEDYFAKAPELSALLRERGKTELAEKMDALGGMCEIRTVRQDKPLGLGHAVLCARELVGDEMFAVCLGDEIFPPWDGQPPPLKVLVDQAQKKQASVIGVMKVALEDTKKYGIIDPGEEQDGVLQVKNTVEKPAPSAAPSQLAIVGRYVFEPLLFDYLADLKLGVGGEYQLTDALARLAEGGKLYGAIVPNNRFDMGSTLGFLQAQPQGGLRRPELAESLKAYIKSLC